MKKVFGIAAMLFALAACSSIETEIQSVSNKEGITITAKLAPKGANTKAVADGGNKITATWAENEHIAILYEVSSTKKVADAEITAVDGSGTATITFTVDGGTTNDTPCTLVYPAKLTDGTTTVYKDDHTGVKDAATLLAAQDGTLNANLDVRVGEGTIQTTTPGLTVTTQPAAQFAIFKFTVKNSDASATINVKPLTVTIGAQDYVITPASATSELYVALPAISSQEVTFTATGSDSKTYTASKASVTFVAGKYYQSNIKMTEVPAATGHALSASVVGEIVGSDGLAYALSYKGNLPTGVTAAGMVAYKDGSNGLVIALADEASTMVWSTANGASGAAAHTPAVTGQTWKLPSQDEWKQMFSANGGNEGSYSGLNTAIDNAGGTALQNACYWSSTEHSPGDDVYFVDLYDGDAEWYNDSEGNYFRVRACLAFSSAPAYTLLSAATTADYGKVVCAAGHLHDAKTAVPAGCTAVGILGKVTETGHGLILALQNATDQRWDVINGWESVTTYASTTLKLLPDDTARGSLTSYTTLGSTTVSNWCVAQKSDYEAIFTNLGSTQGDEDGMTYDANVNAFITTGVGGTAISGDSWSATMKDAYLGWLFKSDYWDYRSEEATQSLRPVLAF